MVEAELDRERHGWTVNQSGTTSLFEINIEDMVRSPIPSAPATSVRAAHRPRHRQLLRRGEGGDHAVTGMAEQELVVRQQGRAHRFRVCLPPTRRTLNIGEQKRSRPPDGELPRTSAKDVTPTLLAGGQPRQTFEALVSLCARTICKRWRTLALVITSARVHPPITMTLVGDTP